MRPPARLPRSSAVARAGASNTTPHHGGTIGATVPSAHVCVGGGRGEHHPHLPSDICTRAVVRGGGGGGGGGDADGEEEQLLQQLDKIRRARRRCAGAVYCSVFYRQKKTKRQRCTPRHLARLSMHVANLFASTITIFLIVTMAIYLSTHLLP